MGAYYIVNFCKKNYNVRILKACITRTYGRNQHFIIAWLPMDSKSRTVIPEEPTEEITEYRTNGGFHGSEKDIIWIGNKINSRKDFAEIVYKYIKSIFEKSWDYKKLKLNGKETSTKILVKHKWKI